MRVIDFNDNVTMFEFDNDPEFLGINVYSDSENYRGVFTFPAVNNTNGTNTNGTRRNLGGKTPSSHDFNEHVEEGAVSGRNLLNHMEGGTVTIYTNDCLPGQTMDPLSLHVTAVSSEGKTLPIATTKVATGIYEATFLLQDTEEIDEILDLLCTAINTAGAFCPVIMGKRHCNLCFVC